MSYPKIFGITLCWIGCVCLISGGIIVKSGYLEVISAPIYPTQNSCLLGGLRIQAVECTNTQLCCVLDGGNCIDYCIQDTCYNLLGLMVLQDSGVQMMAVLVSGESFHDVWLAYGTYTVGTTYPCWVNPCCLQVSDACPSYEDPSACLLFGFQPPTSSLYGGCAVLAVGCLALVSALACYFVYWFKAEREQ